MQQQRSALLRMQFINAVSCRRLLNPDWRPAAESWRVRAPKPTAHRTSACLP